MARLPAQRQSSVDGGPTSPVSARISPSPSLTASHSSDKENHQARRRNLVKGKMKATMSERRSALSTPMSEDRSSKRRKLAERDANGRQGVASTNYYNPEQDPKERRSVMLKMRAHHKELHDRRDVILEQPEELKSLVERQNEAMDSVKQTSDATIDSRFLVHASDLALKQATTLASGESAACLDIDEFVSKCMTFMRFGLPGTRGEDIRQNGRSAPSATQRRRTRVRQDEEEEELNETGDALPWHRLGELASTYNRRPALPSFLLGPLSVQKRARAATQRTQRQRRETQAAATKPQQLQAEDIEKNEATNLTSLCRGIRHRLIDVLQENSQAVETELEQLVEESQTNDISTEVEKAAFRRHRLSTNWEVSLFEFAINPHSFAQSVENLFYVSFLIKDGFVGLTKDEDGLPTIRFHGDVPDIEEQRQQQQQQQKQANGNGTGTGGSRHQAIFSLDYRTWRKLIRAFDIKEPMIADRSEELAAAPTGNGWYG